MRHQGLGPAEQEEPTVVEGEVKPVQHPRLGFRVQVHQGVPAGEQIDPGDRRVVDEVVPAEDHLSAQVLTEDVKPVAALEILLQ